MKKALVIYHANCDDGFGAAFAFWKFAAQNYDSVVYHPAKYGDLPPRVDTETQVFILDFSYDPLVTCMLANESKHVNVLDHHKSALEKWNTFAEHSPQAIPRNLAVRFDMDSSGAMMAFKSFSLGETHFIISLYERFFNFLQDRDLWKFENPDTQYFTHFLRSIPQDFTAWAQLATDLTYRGTYDTIIACGKKLKEFFDKQCQDIIATNKQSIQISSTNTGLCVNCTGQFASDIGNLLAKESGTYGATYYLNSKDEWVFSLRSIGDYDVSEIAARFGGGGHKNAAGFKFRDGDPIDVITKPIVEGGTNGN